MIHMIQELFGQTLSTAEAKNGLWRPLGKGDIPIFIGFCCV
jgi:hypothetical protein